MGGPVRPSGYIGWASATGVTNIVEPPDTTKALGWGQSATPPSAYENWLRQNQDRALQYLQWKSEMYPVLEDEFENVLPAWPYVYPGVGSTQYWWGGASAAYPLGAKWVANTYNSVAAIGPDNIYPSGIDPGYGYDPAKNGRLGVVTVSNTNGYAEFKGRIGQLAGRDFRMEMVYYETTRGTPASGSVTGYSMDMGIFISSGCLYPTYGFPVTKFLTFGWTGVSGILGATVTPTGQAPTSVSFGVPAPFQQWTKLCVEGRSPTMAFYMNDKLVGAMPFAWCGGSGLIEYLGMRGGAFNIGNSTGVGMYIDSLRLDARKTPT